MSSFKGKLKDFVFSTLPGWDAPCQSTRLLVFSDNSFRNKQGIDFIYKNRRVDRLVVFLSLPDLRDVFQSNLSFLNHHLFIEQIFSQCFPFFFHISGFEIRSRYVYFHKATDVTVMCSQDEIQLHWVIKITGQ